MTRHRQLVLLADGVYDYCAAYAKSPSRGHRLIVCGTNGTGKTHAGKAISRWAKRLAIELPLVDGDDGPRLSQCRFVFWPDFCKRAKDGNWNAFEELKGIELLVLDDIGAEHDPSKWAAEQLYLILERREYRWTVITSNYGPEQWDKVFEKRIASRLMRNSKILSTENVPDYNAMV